MADILITRDESGEIVGLGEDDKKAYAKFISMLRSMEVGEVKKISHWFDRNRKLQGLHFVMLNTVFDAQDQFTKPETFRGWAYVGAEFADLVPGPHGKAVAIPRSISFAAADDAIASKAHDDVLLFLRSPRATQFLWGHLSLAEQSDMASMLLDEFVYRPTEGKTRPKRIAARRMGTFPEIPKQQGMT